MNVINEVGTLAIAVRMQKLGDAIRKDATKIYKEHGIKFESKWFPIVYLLDKKSSLSIVEISSELAYSHPSIIALIKELNSKKLIKSINDKSDGRKRMISLTPKGKEMVIKMKPLWKKMLKVNDIITNNKNNLLKAIEETEGLLEQESFYSRFKKLE